MAKIRLLLLFFCISVVSLYAINTAKAEGFDPNNIISDLEILDYTSMDLADIQKFLENKGSFLATYSCPDAYGITRKASEIIYNAAANNFDCDGAILSDNPTIEERTAKCKKITISPKFL